MARILVVDDDEALRTMLRKTLVRAGHTVVEAADGNEGWKKFHQEPIDLIIMDLIMPGTEGLETIRLFRKNKIEVKIIAISGGGRIDARDLLAIARQFGADHILPKPFASADLFAALARLLPADGPVEEKKP